MTLFVGSLNESVHPAEFLAGPFDANKCAEVWGQFTGDELPIGRVVLSQKFGARSVGAITAASWNVGNGTAILGAFPSATPILDVGSTGPFCIRMLNATTWVLLRADGRQEGAPAPVGSNQTRGGILVNIAAGPTQFAPGDEFFFTVTAQPALSTVYQSVNAAILQDPPFYTLGIVMNRELDGLGNTKSATVLVRDAVINKDEIMAANPALTSNQRVAAVVFERLAAQQVVAR
jgi:hypothetical protein